MTEIYNNDDQPEMVTSKKPTIYGVPLVAEDHPSNYSGLPFLTLVQYQNKQELVLVDNMLETQLRVYVLDICDAVGTDLGNVLDVAHNWWKHSRSRWPLSVEFARAGIVKDTEPLLRTIPTDSVTRLIGPVSVFHFGKNSTNPIRRRKKRSIPPSVTIVERSV